MHHSKQDEFPIKFKKAYVTHMSQNIDKLDSTTYRHISVTSMYKKTFDCLLLNALTEHMANSQIGGNQKEFEKIYI